MDFLKLYWHINGQ
jgi:hypothetical protein